MNSCTAFQSHLFLLFSFICNIFNASGSIDAAKHLRTDSFEFLLNFFPIIMTLHLDCVTTDTSQFNLDIFQKKFNAPGNIFLKIVTYTDKQRH